ncbi:MAG TPA: hypothetical protein V6C84_03085 [Coleofasciculaceae cyanobacterium]
MVWSSRWSGLEQGYSNPKSGAKFPHGVVWAKCPRPNAEPRSPIFYQASSPLNLSLGILNLEIPGEFNDVCSCN